MPTHILALIGAIVAEVVGTASLQASAQFTRLVPSLGVVFAYAVSFYLLSIALKVVPVGIAYAVWSGLGIVLITLIGLVVFDQKLDMAAVIGLSLIVTGVAVIQLFSGATTH